MKICPHCGEEFRGEKCPCCGKEYKQEENNTYNNSSLKANDKKMEDIFTSAVESVVCIKVGNSHGTGWCAVEDELIITNAHVVAKYNQFNPIYCELKNENIVPMKIVYLEVNEDIAFLKPLEKGSLKSLKKLTISNKELHVCERVITIGNPIYYKFVPTEGIIKNPKFKDIEPSNRKFPLLHTSIDIKGGNSGGPIFNMDGEVVGMSVLSHLFPTDTKYYEGSNPYNVKNIGVWKEITSNGLGVSKEAILSSVQIYKYNKKD